jgi:hypothetical protein
LRKYEQEVEDNSTVEEKQESEEAKGQFSRGSVKEKVSSMQVDAGSHHDHESSVCQER